MVVKYIMQIREIIPILVEAETLNFFNESKTSQPRTNITISKALFRPIHSALKNQRNLLRSISYLSGVIIQL